jgi:hypothetical protein
MGNVKASIIITLFVKLYILFSIWFKRLILVMFLTCNLYHSMTSTEIAGEL